MTGGGIEAFLKLFCITESKYGSWQSWMVLFVCLASAIATASSGGYFHSIDAVKSSVVCFIVSTVGFGMALVTLLAIVIGCKRRRRIPDPEAQIGETTIYTNPVTSDQSTSIAIEDSPSETQAVEQMWMNPVFAEYDKSLYEADWNKKDNGEKDDGANNGDDGTSIDERDSDYFHSSSETMTWSYKSYSEDEGCFPHSSKESYLNSKESYIKDVGRGHAKSLSVYQDKVLFNSKNSSPSVLKVAEIGSLNRQNDRAMKIKDLLNDPNSHSLASSGEISVQKVSNNQHNSKFSGSHFKQKGRTNPVFWGSNGNSSSSTSCFETEALSNENLAFVNKYGLHLYCESEPDIDYIDEENVADILDSSQTSEGSRNSFDHEDSCEKRNDGNLWTSTKYHDGYVTPEFIGRYNCLKQEDDNEKYLTNHQVLKESQLSNECQISSKATTEFAMFVEDENSSNRSNTKNNFKSRYNSDLIFSHEAASKMNEMHNSNLESIPENRNCLSVNKFDFDISYEEDYSNSEIAEMKEPEQFFIPRYPKRPLLDINGVPISQKELVKVLTRLLISGVQDKPKIVSHSKALI